MATFHQAVVLLLVAVISVQCKIYLVHKSSKTGKCGYNGYVPGGHGPSIKRITSPEAKLQEEQMSMLAFKDPTVNKVKSVSRKYYDQLVTVFGDVCPQIGIGLGVFGLATMIEGDISGSAPPTHADVIKSVNTAFEKLTKDVNARFDRMQHYVNHQIMKSERDLVNVKLRSIFKSWEDCIDEKTKNGAIMCQKNAVRKMRGERPFFYPGFDKRKTWSLSNRPPVDDVIKMEANFILFRDYALINIMMVQTLVNIYREDKKLPNANILRDQYINQLSEDANDAIEYAEFVFKWLKDLYDERSKNYCKDSLTCKRKQEGDILRGDCACIFAANLKEECHTQIQIKTKGGQVAPFARKDIPDWVKSNDKAMTYVAEMFLNDGSAYHDNYNAKLYRVLLRRDMEKYWQNEILDLIPTWRNIANKGKQKTGISTTSTSGGSVNVNVGSAVRGALSRFGRRDMIPNY
ncbi:uncharacterized protein [Clytia hemisphaerica]|uniref:Uncharacterized protein n=1 Tax=Clytia hemisphaerica TaxID=252671 RepID=A0A7M5UY04_9CNID|eukprot:TCONS_00036316-protein